MWDVIVVGAGIVGCSVARELSRFRLKILVLEKEFDICAGASKGNSAVVHSGFDPIPNTNKARFNVLGNAMYDSLCDALDVPFRRNGMIVFAVNLDQMAEVQKLKRFGNSNGVPVEILDRDGLCKIEPDIGPKVIGGLWAPTSGMVCPYTLVFAMAENASLNGVEFSTNSEVKDITRIKDAWLIRTKHDEYVGKVVVNCAGSHADQLNNMVSSQKIKMILRQGSHILLDRKYGSLVKTTISQTPTALPGGGHTKGMAIMPTMDGTVLLGANTVEINDPDDTSLTSGGINSIIQFFKENWEHLPIGKIIPEFPSDGVIASFSGVRAHSADNDFIIGLATGTQNFYNAAGIESPGIAAGPAIGMYLSKLIVEALSPELNKDFIPGRVAKKAFRTMTMDERKAAIQEDIDYAKIVCRCELVTEAEIRDAIRRPLGAKSIQGIKMRTRAGMGRCQGGFCSPRVLQILGEELGISPLKITLNGRGSNVLLRSIGCRCSGEATDNNEC